MSVPPLRVPAAVLRVWADPLPAAHLERRDEARALGGHTVGPGIFAFAPAPGDPAVFDRAVRLGQRLLAALVAEAGQGKVRALVAPGAVRVSEAGVELLDDALLAELARRPPPLAPDALHLTGHAARGLEGRWATANGANLQIGSGRVVPTVVLGPPAPGLPPWRNPEVLARTLRWVPRAEDVAGLTERLDRPVLRLTGRPGSGKTRLAWEVLRSSGRAALWRRGAVDSPEPLPPLDRAIAAERQRPLWIVFDSLDGAPETAWVEIAALLARPDLGAGLHALLIGRAGTPWPEPLLPAPEMKLGPLRGEEWQRFCFQAFHGLALPLGLAERLAEHAAGNPFVLEEALHFLVRERQLRQVFGSFFFSGSEERAEFHPSSRLRLHVEAEAARFAPSAPLRLLALSPSAVPVSELSAAVFALGGELPGRGWEEAGVAAGFFVAREGPWGDGLRLAEPVDALALAGALDPSDAASLQRTLGELLAARSATAEELWGAWPFLSGTDEGVRTLLGALAAPGAKLPREEVFAALRDELASLGERRGESALELDLLWALLPTARRLGRLHELEGAIERGLELSRDRADRFLAIAAVAAELHQKAGRIPQAESVLRRALAIAQGGEPRKQELLLIELARVLVRQGRRAEAQELLGKTLAAAERAGRRTTEATCRFLLGNIALHEFRLAEAEALHRAALAHRRSAGAPAALAASLSALGAVAFAQGDFATSLDRYGEARRTVSGEGAEGDEAYALLGVGRARLRLGAAAEAAPELKRALALREGRDDAVGEAIARVAVAEAHLALGQLEEALQDARRALFTLSLIAEVDARADAERVLGHVLLRLRRPEEAAPRLAEAERIYRGVGNRLAILATLGLALEAALAAGDAPRIEAAFAALAAEREATGEIAAGSLLDYPLHLAAVWLHKAKRPAPDPLAYLRSAYHELLRQTSFLEPKMRQRFLFQIPENAAILDAATRAGLAMPPG